MFNKQCKTSLGEMMAPGTSSMLRARRRDVNVKPNRRLDRKSSRGMLYENEELRLRTININAEVERGQNDIKKLRRENEQLRREIWGLREEYDRLEGLLGKAKRRSGQDEDTDNGEEEDLEYDEEEDDDDEADLDNAENQQKASSTPRSRRNSVRVLFDGLSVVDEETDEDATCDSAGSKHKAEQQFFGKIKLPSGKEGVFMSDVLVPNSNGVQVCACPQQSHYNYTFTPVDTANKLATVQDNDGYFGTVPSGEFYPNRGGPDVFISGAYPATCSTTFPVGGNLDQLLKQINGKDNERVATVQIQDAEQVAQGDAQTEVKETKHVQEVIDALEVQLDSKLEETVEGVRVVNGSCFVCLNDEGTVDALLKNGLNILGETLALQSTSRDSILVSASGVPHDISDEKLTKSLNQHASVIDVERKLYKGVDTGERRIKLKSHDAEIPTSIVVEGSRIALKVVEPAGETCVIAENPSTPTDNSLTADRFRSQISVRLRQPNPKNNRSLDNIFDTVPSKKLHNTSLPIINAFENALFLEQETNTVKNENAKLLGATENAFQLSLPENNKDSKIPNRRPMFLNVQSHNAIDESTDSVEMINQTPAPFQNNPFVGFQTSTPITAVPANPFMATPSYTSQEPQKHLFMPQVTRSVRVCSPFPHLNSPFTTQAPASGLPSPVHTPQNSPQINTIPNFPFDNPSYFQSHTAKGSAPNPGFFLPASYVGNDVEPLPSGINIQQSQPCTNADHSRDAVEIAKPQSTSMPSSPVAGRRQKPSILSHQHSKSSGDEGPRASPGAARRKLSRKQSSTNSIKSQQNVETSGGPNATSSPNIKHKTSTTHSRKTSGGPASGAETSGSGQINAVDVSRSSSSGQDSPTKPDRRRRVSIYFNNKKGTKRRDSVFVANGGGAPGGGILTRSLSLEATHRYGGGSTTDVATGHSAGAETTTCSERERTNSASSRTSSATATGRLRKPSECSRGGSINDGGKVPWCGCWGNGCI